MRFESHADATKNKELICAEEMDEAGKNRDGKKCGNAQDQWQEQD